ncbi:MAG: MarR family transcriptional regulator [Butyrivibrio sp.]|nr:MarR family transcriptional regulator [Butyrivibrio sp.]
MEEMDEECLENRHMPLSFEFKRMNNLMSRHIHSGLVGGGFDEITIMHGWILGFLHGNRDRKIYQRDLENRFGIAKSTVTNILKLMEKKGYVTRVEDADDARLKQLRLTKLGEDTHKETIRIIDETNRGMEKGITDEEKEVFYAILDKLRKNMEGSKEEAKND